MSKSEARTSKALMELVIEVVLPLSRNYMQLSISVN